MNNLKSGLPWTATEKHCNASWNGGHKGKYFRCNFCGHKFVVGDTVRWIYTNSTQGAFGNPFVCQECDDTNDVLIEKWKEMHLEADGRMWWFCVDREQ